MNNLSIMKIKMKLRNKISLFIFEIFYKTAFYVTSILLLQRVFKLTLKFSRFSYITIENINAYLRSPVTIVCIICLLFIVGIFLLTEIISLNAYYFSIFKNKEVNIRQILFPGIKSVSMMFHKKLNIIFMPFFAIVQGVFLMLPLLVAVLTRFRIPTYFFNAVAAKGHLPQMSVIAAILIFLAGCSSMFVLHYCSLENKGFFEAYKNSVKLLLKHGFVVFKTLFIKNLMLLTAFFVIYYACLAFTGLMLYLFVYEDIMISAYIGVYDKLNVFSAIIFTMIGMLVNLSAITKIFATYREDEGEALGYEIEKIQIEISNEMEVPIIYAENRKKFLFLGRYQMIISVIFIFVTVYCTAYVFNWVRNGTFTSQHALLRMNITAHRGSSKDAPENTVASIERAIADYADYAEIDVQQTKDGVVILLHDERVNRTTNGTGHIWDYTYYDLIQLDAGRWFSSDFEGIRVPTLAEAIEAAKGRIYLNIELKKNNYNDGIIEKVVKLIEEYDFQQQCVISSTNYSALARVKELNPDIKTGYIMALAYGNFYENEYADFLSIKSGFINENLVKLAHSLGKEVHAWTVNNTAEMERMKSLGVDNIITDEPLSAREVVYSEEHETLSGFLRMLISR